MTILDYYTWKDSIKAKREAESTPERVPTLNELSYRYGGYVLVSRKKKGAGKGYKANYAWQWRDYKGYMSTLRELYPHEYALQLCRDERNELLADRWWDVEGYRDTHIRMYRDRLKAIRVEHGLTKSEVSEFNRVD